jgi:uncharacterized protein YbbC (DUF1343 family)
MLKYLFPFLFIHALLLGEVKVGIENISSDKYTPLLKNKRVGLITNHTAVDHKIRSTIDNIKADAKKRGYTLTALFAPEHGITGAVHATETVKDEKDKDGIPIYSLHGQTRRPTEQMLSHVDAVLYDIQDIGSRSYTYVTTLFYMMEEAAKRKIPVIVLDRPNPINGVVVDGPMLDNKWRSFVGYINVPYCHGMTVGELAKFFNEEYKVNCQLHVVPMSGWKREMTFQETGLPWVPTSPYVPESSTAMYYPITGILGELQLVNIGLGYTLPFKLVGAPWINAKQFADNLNAQKLPGIYFQPFFFKPFYGRFAKLNCEGVLVVVTDPLIFQPVATEYVIIGMIKSLYPKKFKEALEASKGRQDMFNKINGTDKIYQILRDKDYIAWELREFQKDEREAFTEKRKKYLLY